MGKVLTPNKYSKLLGDLRTILEEGRLRAQRAVAEELVLTYWHVGKRIVEEGLTDQAGYGSAIMQDLSDELGIDVSTLERTVVFFKLKKSAPGSGFLTWSHYKYLLSVKNDEARIWYESEASSKNWSRAQLRQAIKENRWQQEMGLSKDAKKKAKQFIKRPTEATYVYKAIVERVVDGDTLLVRLDLGFTTWKEQRIRLAQIDTPSMDVQGGRKAYEYVRDSLAQVEFVMIKTNKIDIYGRYVGHVFYDLKGNLSKSDVFSKGRYLNGELVSKGLANKL